MDPSYIEFARSIQQAENREEKQAVAVAHSSRGEELLRAEYVTILMCFSLIFIGLLLFACVIIVCYKLKKLFSVSRGKSYQAQISSPDRVFSNPSIRTNITCV